MTCLEKYITACDAADAQLSADLAACNGNPSCEKAAVDRHTDAITPAKSEAADHTVTQAPSHQRIVTTTIRIGGDGVAEYDFGGGK